MQKKQVMGYLAVIIVYCIFSFFIYIQRNDAFDQYFDNSHMEKVPADLQQRLLQDIIDGGQTTCGEKKITAKDLGCMFDSIDLNGDRVKEFIVAPIYICGQDQRGVSSNGGYSIFQKINNAWKNIAPSDFGGDFYYIKNKKTNGYYDIVTYRHESTDSVTENYYKWDKNSGSYIKLSSKELTPSVSMDNSDLCTSEPVSDNGIGNSYLPVDPKYGDLGFLGQLFTAYNCGKERVSEVEGMNGDEYTRGFEIWLKNDPSSSLIDVFKSIGFQCGEDNGESSCKQWNLYKAVNIKDVMKLEPYHDNFSGDDCTNCG